MTTATRTSLIDAVLAQHDALEAAWAPLIAAVKNHDFPAYEASWKIFDDYSREISRRIGDENGWLAWFIYENDCGRRGFSAKAAAWTVARPIRTPRALACLLEADLPAPGLASAPVPPA